MSPQFDPNDYDPAKDGQSFTPPPEGDYEFTVTNAVEKDSQAGNAMLNLSLSCEIGRDQPLNIFDNLVFMPTATWKIAQFCQATGFDFSSGQLDAGDAMGLSGKAHLVLGKANEKGKRYMQVAWYCKPEGFTERPAKAAPSMPPQRKLTQAPPVPPAGLPQPDDDAPPPSQAEAEVTGDEIPF